MIMETFVVVEDLCGREPTYCTPISALDSDDQDHILDMFADGQIAYIGEFAYREATDAERAAACVCVVA